jgi:hypothetical protein
MASDRYDGGMNESPAGLGDSASIPRVSVMDDEFPTMRRPAVDSIASLLGWLAILLILAGPATAAYMTFLELNVGPGLFVLQAFVVFPVLIAWGIAAWLRDRKLAKLWAKEKGFTIRSCTLSGEEAEAIAERYLPLSTRERRLTLSADGDPRGVYRGILLISRPLIGNRGFRFRFVAVGYPG